MITKLLNRLADILIKPIMEAIEAMQGDRADLEAMACVSSGKCRRTPDEYVKELCNRMAIKELFRQIEDEEQEIPPELALKLQNAKEIQKDEPSTDDPQAEESKHSKHCFGCLANNGNCGYIIGGAVKDCFKAQRLEKQSRDAYQQAVTDENIRAAEPGKDNAHYESTKKALKESIGLEGE